MKNLFNSIQLTKPKRNVFDLSHDVKLSGDMGNLIPVCVMDTVPGDKFNISAETLIRFAPLLAPIMHRVDVSIHYFFVPNRLLWDNWQEFISNNGDSNVVAPYTEFNGNEGISAEYLKFLDYMGVPTLSTSSANSVRLNALPFSAYQLIYNEYYRDQNLIQPVNFKCSDGDNTTNYTELYKLRKRAWEHDYFTAALPFAQKGQAVDIPLGNVQLNLDNYEAGNAPVFKTPAGLVTGFTVTNVATPHEGIISAGIDRIYDPKDTLEVPPTSINELRRAFRLQEWLEKNARGGTRYIENILAHFGVKSSDARLQRPEYITGVKTPVVISEVLNTTGIDGELPQGNMAGHGVAVTTGKFGSYFCEEHGWIIGIMSVMPKTAYQQGLPKMLQRFDNLDYYWPSFANIGEQEVKRSELFAFTANDNDTFGYVPRYAEYKYMPSRVAGEFRNSLDYWHLGRKFNTSPSLNQQFIECDSSATKRIFAVEEGADTLYCHVLNKIQAIRPMPKFGTPMF